MNWWEAANQWKDETLAGITKAVTDVTGSAEQFYSTIVPPTTQIATTSTTAKPVAGVETQQSSGVNNNMLIVGIAALIASLYFLKKS